MLNNKSNPFSIILLVFFCFLNSCDNPKSKNVVFTGYADGSLVDFYLIGNQDSTYQLINIESTYGTWLSHNDSILLMEKGIICAIIFDNKLIEYYCDDFKVLELMTFKKFKSPRTLKQFR